MAKKKSGPAARAAHRFTPDLIEKRRKSYVEIPFRSDGLTSLERDLQRLEHALNHGARAQTPGEESLATFLRAGIGACIRAVDEGNAAGAAVAMGIACQGYYGLMNGRLRRAARQAIAEPRSLAGKKSGEKRRSVREPEVRRIKDRIAMLSEAAQRNGKSTRGIVRRACRERATAKLLPDASKEQIHRATLALEARFRRSQSDAS